MITSPETNIKLTDADIARIQKVEERLYTLTREIDIASAHSNVLKDDCIKLEKEKKYLEEQVTTLTDTIFNLAKEVTSLKETINSGKQTLTDFESKSKEITDIHKNKEEYIKQKENDLFLSETEHEKVLNDFKKDSEVLENKRTLVDKNLEILQSAVDSISW